MSIKRIKQQIMYMQVLKVWEECVYVTNYMLNSLRQ
jgi:hypothetical protein